MQLPCGADGCLGLFTILLFAFDNILNRFVEGLHLRNCFVCHLMVLCVSVWSSCVSLWLFYFTGVSLKTT